MTEQTQSGSVPESDLVAELGLPSRKMADIRRKHLTSHDWWKAGRGGKVWLTAEGAAKLRIFAECGKTEPMVVSRFIGGKRRDPTPDAPVVTVWEKFPNQRCGKCKIKINYGPEKGHLIEECVIPIRLHSLLTRDKPVRVEVVRDATGVTYRHELLATRY